MGKIVFSGLVLLLLAGLFKVWIVDVNDMQGLVVQTTHGYNRNLVYYFSIGVGTKHIYRFYSIVAFMNLIHATIAFLLINI